MNLSDGAKAVYEIADKMGIDNVSMEDMEFIINTMEYMEKNKKSIG